MSENNEAPQEIELQIAPIEPTITRETARMSYQFMMPALVARLYLYLFGEFDRDVVELAVEKVSEYNTVLRQILDREKAPLRALYDYLIEQDILEDQKLSEAAMVYLNEQDSIQLRMVSNAEEPTAPE